MMAPTRCRQYDKALAAEPQGRDAGFVMEFLAHQRAAYNAVRDGEFREYWSWGAIRTGKSVGHGAGFTRMMIAEPGPYFVTNPARATCGPSSGR